jgi:hypothetical protein
MCVGICVWKLELGMRDFCSKLVKSRGESNGENTDFSNIAFYESLKKAF